MLSDFEIIDFRIQQLNRIINQLDFSVKQMGLKYIAKDRIIAD